MTTEQYMDPKEPHKNASVSRASTEAVQLVKDLERKSTGEQSHDIMLAISLICSALHSINSELDTLKDHFFTAHPEFWFNHPEEKAKLKKAIAVQKKLIRNLTS
jgi:hypothetical protein